jgi:hypothetical protein
MIQQYDLLFNNHSEESDYYSIIESAKDEDGTLLASKLGAEAGIG